MIPRYTIYWLFDLIQLSSLLKPHTLYPENVSEMILYLPCRVVAEINLDVAIGKVTGHNSMQLGSPGKNLRKRCFVCNETQ